MSGGKVKGVRRRLRRDDRRARIVEAALEVFAAKGYSETAMEDVAEAAGVTRSVLYDHFASKKDLYVTLLVMQRDEVMQYVASRATQASDPQALVRSAIESFFSFVRSHPVTWRMLFHDYVGDPDVMAAHTAAQAEASLIMSGLLIGESGHFPAVARMSPPEREILGHIWGAGLKAVARWWRDNPKVTQETIVDTAMLALWPGMLALSGGNGGGVAGGNNARARYRRRT